MFRAIAIIAVVMIHTTPAGQWQVFCKPFINFAVATFIFLSGYLTKADNENWLKFYVRRITRVLVPYIIWTAIYSIPDIRSSGPSALVKNLLCANATTTLYYIFVYIQFVLLTPLLGKLAKSPYRHLGWLIAPLSVIIFKYIPVFGDIQLGKHIQLFWNDACLGWFTFYYLGLILGNRIIDRQLNIRNMAVLYCASLLDRRLFFRNISGAYDVLEGIGATGVLFCNPLSDNISDCVVRQSHLLLCMYCSNG